MIVESSTARQGVKMSGKKSEKFFIYARKRSGYKKGKRLLGVKDPYEGDIENPTLQDLIEFLREKDIDPSTVVLPSSFTMFVKV